ncbi:hypothetical protein SHKM778_75970 [Streptomyces sp. KM77-8]|uniref:Uncharacterized protein n=1 Tax=Streptomyces haneummycinicus TaxID=3074435 RepID=A0AAT9HVA3_9ACTN
MRGEVPGDEQMRLRNVQVGEDVAVEARLDVFRCRRAQGDEEAGAGEFPGGGLAEFGDGRAGRRRGESRECSNCLRNADSSDAARSRTSAYPSRVIDSSSST